VSDDVDTPAPDDTGDWPVEARYAGGEVAYRGHLRRTTAAPRLFQSPADPRRWFTVESWSTSPDEPSIFVESRVGTFIPGDKL
jgi:hypothetical protein